MGGASSRGSTQLSTVMCCEREYAFAYILKLRPTAQSIPLDFGTAIHSSMEWHYLRQMAERKVEPPAFVCAPGWVDREPMAERQAKALSLDRRAYIEQETWDFDLAEKALAIGEAYTERYAEDDEKNWETLFVEQEFGVRVGDLDPGGPCPEIDDEVVTAKADRIARNKATGLIAGFDFKSEPGDFRRPDLEPWPSLGGAYEINFQSMFYAAVTRLALPGETLGSWIIERVKKTQPYAFLRHPLKFPPLKYAAIGRSIRKKVKRELEVHAKILSGVGPDDNESACTQRWVREEDGIGGPRKYGNCPYLQICSAGSVKSQNEIVETLYQVVGKPKASFVILQGD